MSTLKSIGLSVIAAGILLSSSPQAPSQISIGIGEPSCPYGYFDYAPYDCSPYGYYGPDWFNGGVFIGAGRWFHGPRGFSGHVDNRYDPRRGYHGPMPGHGEQAFNHFHGNEARDGQGHVGNAGHDAGGERNPEAHGGFGGGGHGGGEGHGGGGHR
jgi:hypothetical protein